MSRSPRRTKKSRLDDEIDAALSTPGPVRVEGLAGILADPAAARTFAREMRHEIHTRQTSERTAAALAGRPFVARRVEDGRRTLLGRYPSEGEAIAAARRSGGWVEHEGRVIYGRDPDAVAQPRSLPGDDPELWSDQELADRIRRHLRRGSASLRDTRAFGAAMDEAIERERARGVTGTREEIWELLLARYRA